MAATGKSTGIPHELGSTAYGVVLSIEETIKNMEMPISLNGATAIVEGIGEVGGNAIKILLDKGTAILGVSDITGSIYSPHGLQGEKLVKLINEKISVKIMATTFPSASFHTNPAELLGQSADVLILAGAGRSLNERTCSSLKVKIIGEGSNIAYCDPVQRDIVNQRGIISIPGIIANSGGVISSYEEWVLENENQMLTSNEEKWERVKNSIDRRIKHNIKELCAKIVTAPNWNPYQYALAMANERLELSRIETIKLKKQTKRINRQLEEKFAVYTK